MGRVYAKDIGASTKGRRVYSNELAPDTPNQGVSAPSSGPVRDFFEGAAVSGGRMLDTLGNAALNLSFNPYGYGDTGAYAEGQADRISEATAENPTRMRVAGEGVGGATMAIPTLALTGGASTPLVVSSLAGGAAGSLASDQARRMGGGGLAQFGAGLVADLATGGLVRAAFSAPDLARRAVARVSPTARAGKYVSALDLGTENADDVALAIDDAYRIGKEDVDKAWDAYRAVPTQATTSSEPFHRLAAAQASETALKPSDLPEIASRVPKTLTDEVGVEDVNRVLKTVASTQLDDAATPNAKRLAGQFREVAQGALDEIEAASAADQAAVKALQGARRASRTFAEAFPDDSSIYKAFISKKSADEPQEAFMTLLRSPKRETEMKLVMQAVGGNRQAQRGVRKAMVHAVTGTSDELAAQAPTAALRRLDKYEGAARVALGEKGFNHFRSLLAEQATANRERGFVWRWLAGRGNPAKGMALGTIVGGQVAGPEGATGGMLIGGAMDLLAQRLSPRAVREIAIQSLYDPDLYRQVTRQIPSGVPAQEWAQTMIGSLVRRGVLTKEEAEGAE